MYLWFTQLLNVSLTAGLLAATILPVRLLLKKAPKRLLCLLWALVALRLLLPFSIPSPFSALGALDVPTDAAGQALYFQYNGKAEKPELTFDLPVLTAENTAPAQHTSDLYLPTVMNFWAAGVLVMMGYGVISTLQLKKSVAASLPIEENLYLCDDLPTAFILGVVRPKIYLPSGLPQSARSHVIAHEQAHLQRHDHWWKPLGYLLLSVHWFNPMLWVAYLLLCRDIEAACDEQVIAGLDGHGKAEYAEALLTCASRRRLVTACPVAFGETDVKGRVNGILNYKKPTFWLLCGAGAAGAVLAVLFLTSPSQPTPEDAVILTAEITEMQGDSIQVRPVADTWEKTVSDSFVIGNFSQYAVGGASYQVGDFVHIAYNGEILETYPATLGEIYHISAPAPLESVSSAVRFVTRFPRNRYTRCIPEPSAGTIDYVLDNSQNGSYFVFWKEISYEDAKAYADRLKDQGYAVISEAVEDASSSWLMQKDDVLVGVSCTEGGLAVQIIQPAAVAGESSAPSAYTLTIGADGVAKIDLSLKGQQCHLWEGLDGETLENGEKLDLIALQGVPDLRGLQLTAYDSAGQVLLECSVPDKASNAGLTHFTMDDWEISPAGEEIVSPIGMKIILDDVTYRCTGREVPVEPDESVVEYVEIPMGTSGTISAFARLEGGKLVCLMNEEWVEFAAE